jgi:uncharacterized membrane protein
MLKNALTSVYNFLVGDLRILIGVLVLLPLVALVAQWLPSVAGLFMLVLVIGTLFVTLRYETIPKRQEKR